MQADGHEKSRVALSDQVRGKISELIHNRTLVGGDVIIDGQGGVAFYPWDKQWIVVDGFIFENGADTIFCRGASHNGTVRNGRIRGASREAIQAELAELMMLRLEASLMMPGTTSESLRPSVDQRPPSEPR